MTSQLAPKSANNLNRELANLVCNLNVDRHETSADIPNISLWPIRELASSTRSKAAVRESSTSGHASILPAEVRKSRTLNTTTSHNTVLSKSSQPSQYQTSATSSNIKNYKPSHFRGVYSLRGKWHVRVCFKGKRLYMGPFETEEVAARKYDETVILVGRPTNFSETVLEDVPESATTSSRSKVTPGPSYQARILAELDSKLRVSPMQPRRRGGDMLPRSDQSTFHEHAAPCDMHNLTEGECEKNSHLKVVLQEGNNLTSNSSLVSSSLNDPGPELHLQASLSASTMEGKVSIAKKLSQKHGKFARFTYKELNHAKCATVSAKKKCVVSDAELIHDLPTPLSEHAQFADACNKGPEESAVPPTEAEFSLPEQHSASNVDINTESHVEMNFEQPPLHREIDACDTAVVAAQPAQLKRKCSMPLQQPRSLNLEPPTVKLLDSTSSFLSAEINEATPSSETQLSCKTVVEAEVAPSDLWVQCDVCEKWRLMSVPENFRANEKWVCSMNASDPLQNYCEAPEISWKSSSQSGNSVRKRLRVLDELYKTLRALSCGKFQFDSDEQQLLGQRVLFAKIDPVVKTSRIIKQPRWLRYERYMKAQHIGEVFRLGGSGKDLIEDLKENRAVLVDSPLDCTKLDLGGGTDLDGGSSCSAYDQDATERSALAADAGGSHLRFTDVHASTIEQLARAHRISEAVNCFQTLDSNAWFLRTEIRPEVQRVYCEANEGKPGAAPFSLSVQGKEKLAQGTKEILQDWDKYLRSNHPGFSSYGATVGEHDGAEQEKHTRVVGPSEAHWNSFHERYGWFKDVLAEIEDFVRSEVVANYSATREDRRVQRQAKQAERKERRRLRLQSSTSRKKEESPTSTSQNESSKHNNNKEPRLKKRTIDNTEYEHNCDNDDDSDAAEIAAELEADRLFEAEAEEGSMLPCELHDMHILRQVSSATEGGGAVFDDHQDRHAEMHNGKTLRWTVTLLVHSTGPPTGFFMWNSRSRPSDDTGRDGTVRGVIPYDAPGHGVLFPSMAWHRSVLAARSSWPFEAMKFSFFFAAPTDRARRYYRASLYRNSIADKTAQTKRTKKNPKN